MRHDEVHLQLKCATSSLSHLIDCYVCVIGIFFLGIILACDYYVCRRTHAVASSKLNLVVGENEATRIIAT